MQGTFTYKANGYRSKIKFQKPENVLFLNKLIDRLCMQRSINVLDEASDAGSELWDLGMLEGLESAYQALLEEGEDKAMVLLKDFYVGTTNKRLIIISVITISICLCLWALFLTSLP